LERKVLKTARGDPAGAREQVGVPDGTDDYAADERGVANPSADRALSPRCLCRLLRNEEIACKVRARPESPPEKKRSKKSRAIIITKIDPEKQRQKVGERETGEAPRGNKPESCTPFHQ
jgi:hypothetical protein